MCKLLQILIATPCNTSCEEGTLLFTNGLCPKEQLFITLGDFVVIGNFEIASKNLKDFDDEIELLEKLRISFSLYFIS